MIRTLRRPVQQMLRQLKVGESFVTPLEKEPSVRSQASRFGMVWNKKFTTKANRQDRTLKVTRLA